MPLPAPFRLLRLLLALLVLAAVSCTIRDPEGTEWDTVIRVRSAPESLFVSEASENEYVSFDPDGQLRLVERIAPVHSRLGDSLVLRGTGLRLELPLGPVRLPDLPPMDAGLPFEALFPDFAPLVGQTLRLVEARPFDLALPLPAWEELDWAMLRPSPAALAAGHPFAFALDGLRLRLVNALGDTLLDEALGDAGALEPQADWNGERTLAGLLLPPLSLRLSGVNRPMDAAAPVVGGDLVLGLGLAGALADSARGLLGVQELAGEGTVDGDPRWLVREARSRDFQLTLQVANGLEAGVELAVSWPDWIDPATDRAFELAVPELAGGSSSLVNAAADRLRLLPADQEAPQGFPVLVSGSTLPQAEALTLRAGDRLELELQDWTTRLSLFEGRVLENVDVEIEAGQRSITAWPTELVDIDLSEVEVQFRMDRDLRLDLEAELVLDVVSAPATGLADTTMVLRRSVVAGDSLLRVPRMGALLSRLPESLGFSGRLRLPAGTDVELADTSEARLLTVEIPARGNLRRLRWTAATDPVEEPLPDEVEQVTLLAILVNGVPLGGRVQAWITADSLEEGVLAFDEELTPALWLDDAAVPVADTVSVSLPEEALAIARGERWWARYEIQLQDSGERTVAIRDRQALVIVTQAEALVPVELGGGGTP